MGWATPHRKHYGASFPLTWQKQASMPYTMFETNELEEVRHGSGHNTASPVLGKHHCNCTCSCLAIKLCAKKCFHRLDRAREQVHMFIVSLPHARVAEARAENHKMSHTIEDNILPMYEIWFVQVGPVLVWVSKTGFCHLQNLDLRDMDAIQLSRPAWWAPKKKV